MALIRCDEARERFSDLLTGGEEPGPELAGHLSACESCRQALDRQRKAFRMASQAVFALEPDPASWLRLKEEMGEIHLEWARRDAFKRRLLVGLAFALPVLAALAWLGWKSA